MAVSEGRNGIKGGLFFFRDERYIFPKRKDFSGRKPMEAIGNMLQWIEKATWAN